MVTDRTARRLCGALSPELCYLMGILLGLTIGLFLSNFAAGFALGIAIGVVIDAWERHPGVARR